MTKEEMRDAARAEYEKRLDEINTMPDEVDPEVQWAIELLQSKGFQFPLDK